MDSLPTSTLKLDIDCTTSVYHLPAIPFSATMPSFTNLEFDEKSFVNVELPDCEMQPITPAPARLCEQNNADKKDEEYEDVELDEIKKRNAKTGDEDEYTPPEVSSDVRAAGQHPEAGLHSIYLEYNTLFKAHRNL
jgi:hypothetical protein